MSELFECEEVILEHESLIYFMKTFEIICICFGSIFTFLTVIQFIFVDKLSTIYIHTQFQVSFKSYYFTVWKLLKTLTIFIKNYVKSITYNLGCFKKYFSKKSNFLVFPHCVPITNSHCGHLKNFMLLDFYVKSKLIISKCLLRNFRGFKFLKN